MGVGVWVWVQSKVVSGATASAPTPTVLRVERLPTRQVGRIAAENPGLRALLARDLATGRLKSSTQNSQRAERPRFGE